MRTLSRLAWASMIVATALVSGTYPAAASDHPESMDGVGRNATVRCVDLPAHTQRPTYGCFNLAHIAGLHFNGKAVTWYLYRFTSGKAAAAARGKDGRVLDEAGAVWLSELAPSDTAPARHRGGVLAAKVGPLTLPEAGSYTATLAYAAMPPGARSRVHVHPGPEAFYVIAGEQCVETPGGVKHARAGESFSEPAGVPMELVATGSGVRKGFALVIHDSKLPQASPVAWHSSNRCMASPSRP